MVIGLLAERVWRKMVGQNCVRAKSQSVRIEIESAIDSEKLQ